MPVAQSQAPVAEQLESREQFAPAQMPARRSPHEGGSIFHAATSPLFGKRTNRPRQESKALQRPQEHRSTFWTPPSRGLLAFPVVFLAMEQKASSPPR